MIAVITKEKVRPPVFVTILVIYNMDVVSRIYITTLPDGGRDYSRTELKTNSFIAEYVRILNCNGPNHLRKELQFRNYYVTIKCSQKNNTCRFGYNLKRL